MGGFDVTPVQAERSRIVGIPRQRLGTGHGDGVAIPGAFHPGCLSIVRHGVLDIHLAAFGLDNGHGAALVFIIDRIIAYIEGRSGTGVVLRLALVRCGDDAVLVRRSGAAANLCLTVEAVEQRQLAAGELVQRLAHVVGVHQSTR